MRAVSVKLYASIPDFIDRFIILAAFEGQYTQEEIGSMLNISQVAVSKRMTRTLIFLRSKEKELTSSPPSGVIKNE